MLAPTPAQPSVDTLMARMADGDPAALFELVDGYGSALRFTVLRILRALHRPDVVGDRSAVDDLVLQAGFVLFDRAAGWRPGQAKPWHWAYRAIKAAVVAEIGHPTVELVDTLVTRADTTEPVADVCLDDLAAKNPSVAILRDTLDRVVRPRNRAVFIAYRIQLADGDPSPAVTVGRAFGLNPDNVRQIDRRTRVALARAAAAPGGEPLRELAWVAA